VDAPRLPAGRSERLGRRRRRLIDRLLDQAKNAAADELEVSAGDLEYGAGEFRVKGTDRGLSLFDLAVPLVCFALGPPLSIMAAPGLASVLGWYVVVLLQLVVIAAPMMGVVVNEVVLPRFRGWTVGMLATGLRLPPSQVQLRRLLLRSAVMWLPIIIAMIVFFDAVLNAPELVAYAVRGCPRACRS
jgi:hypothetical protein